MRLGLSSIAISCANAKYTIVHALLLSFNSNESALIEGEEDNRKLLYLGLQINFFLRLF